MGGLAKKTYHLQVTKHEKNLNHLFMEWNLVGISCMFLLELLSPGNGQSIA